MLSAHLDPIQSPASNERAAPLAIAVAGRKGTLPVWLARCLGELARAGAIEVILHEARARRRGGPVRQPTPSGRVSFAAKAPEPARIPGIELFIENEGPATRASERWTISFGASGTHYRSEHARGDRLLAIEIIRTDATGAARRLACTRTRAADSLEASRERAAWKASGLLERALRRRACGQSEAASSRAHTFLSTPRPERPHFVRRVAGVLERLVREDVSGLAWRRRPLSERLPHSPSWRPEHELIPPRGRSFADPFLLEHAGRECLFFHDLDVRSGLGRIACSELANDGSAGRARIVLAGPHSLAHPFVFEHEGSVYMIPQTRAARRIELWRALEFPASWMCERVLIDGLEALATTWFPHGGLYWLFTSHASPGAPLGEELHAFWSRFPFGPWRAHEHNPIVDDPRGAQPAGRPFLHQGRLVRPARDLTIEHEPRLLFQEVLELDPARWAERTLGELGARGHDRSSRHEVVDVRTRRWRCNHTA